MYDFAPPKEHDYLSDTLLLTLMIVYTSPTQVLRLHICIWLENVHVPNNLSRFTRMHPSFHGRLRQ